MAWPPLITAARQPAWMRWRDVGVTALMWLIFAIMLETEFELTFAGVRQLLGHDVQADARWAEYWDKLVPFLQVVAALVAWLALFGVLTQRRRARALALPQPAALPAAADAARAGLAEAALLQARGWRIATVHLNEDNSIRIEGG